LLEEVLMGLDETREALDQAVFILESMIDDFSPDLWDDFHDVFERELLLPLQSRRDTIDHLLVTLAEETEEAGA
ncbi:MAG: hypothetical protein O7G88_02680, partial [bacterium]|nr:hypothetical protein [bacterium]